MPDEYTIDQYINTYMYDNYYKKSSHNEDIKAIKADMAYEDSLFEEE